MSEEKKEPRKVKIEGEAFDLVKAKSKAFDELKAAVNSQLEIAHKDFWDSIEAICPEFGNGANLELDDSHEDLGFYVIREKKSKGLSDLLSSLKQAVEAVRD